MHTSSPEGTSRSLRLVAGALMGLLLTVGFVGVGVGHAADPACSDSVDNDSDGAVDFPADPGCMNATDTDETNPPSGGGSGTPACNDGVDNDSDGAVDFPADPGCSSASDTTESNPAPAVSTCARGGLLGTRTIGENLAPGTNEDGVVSGTLHTVEGSTPAAVRPVVHEASCLVAVVEDAVLPLPPR